MNRVRALAAVMSVAAMVVAPLGATAKTHKNNGRHCGKSHPVKKSCSRGHHGHKGVKK